MAFCSNYDQADKAFVVVQDVEDGSQVTEKLLLHPIF